MGSHTFRTTLLLHGRTATGISVPPEVVEALGAGKRPPVRVTLHAASGPYTYRSTIAPMGGEYLLGVAAEHRAASGVAAGDELDVEVEHDDSPRVVDVPADLAAALDADGEARRFFDGLTASQQRAYTTWIESAKKAETRDNRVAQATQLLREGKKR